VVLKEQAGAPHSPFRTPLSRRAWRIAFWVSATGSSCQPPTSARSALIELSMPIFEYACQDCGREFEAFVTATRTPACPSCEGEKLAKRLSSPGFVGAGTPRAASSPQPSGGCGAGGAGCACRMNWRWTLNP